MFSESMYPLIVANSAVILFMLVAVSYLWGYHNATNKMFIDFKNFLLQNKDFFSKGKKV